MTGNPATSRRGLNFIEVAVVVVIVAVLLLALLFRLPRSREKARMVGCQRNLMQIGVALAQYHADSGHLPVASLNGDGPLRSCLEVLAIPDFRSLTDPKNRVERQSGFVLKEMPVAGFVCPTDTVATSGKSPAPISYRASTGSEPAGQGGAFSLGRFVTFSEVDAKDGLSFTAGFSERLVGDHGPSTKGNLSAMQFVPAALVAPPCPTGAPGTWLTDAGSSWWTSNWSSTLYNHALTPNAPASCLSANGTTGLVGASSQHLEGVNVLLLDGSVKTYSVNVAPKVWRSLGTIDDASNTVGTTVPPVPGTP